MSDKTNSELVLLRQRALRIYVTGLAGTGVIYMAVLAVIRMFPWVSQFENPIIPILIAILALIIVPPTLGIFIFYAVNPFLGSRWNTWNELIQLEERVSGELSKDHEVKIVLINDPSEQERTIAVMTRTFPATDTDSEMASVFIPNGPRGKTGYIRIVPVEDLTDTGWNLREFQLYQLTLGTIAPDELIRRP